MIVDSHVHVDEVPALGWMDPPETILTAMDEAGIDRAVIMTYTDLLGLNAEALEYTVAAVQQYPDRLYGYVRLHPWYPEAMALLKDAWRLGLKGLKLHPVSTLAHPGDSATVALIQSAGTFGFPVLFHCGDEPMTTPWEVAEAVRQCPDTPIILGHMGGYFHVDEAIAVAERYPNVYLDTSAMPYPQKIAEAVMRVGASRVLFASDGPGCSPRLELFKIDRAGLSAADRELVLHANIMRLLEEVES